METPPRALPRRKRLFLSILLGTAIVLVLALTWARVTETAPSTAYVVGFYGLLGLFVVAFYLTYRWSPDNAQRRAAAPSPLRGGAGHGTPQLRNRLTDLALHPTPGAFAAFTIILAFVWAAFAFSFAVYAYASVAGGFDFSMVCFLATLGPPLVVFVLWMVYARRQYLLTFLPPP